MNATKEPRLKELKERLAELKKLDPAHCSDRDTFVPHSMSRELYRQIEELEEQIKTLEGK